ncbi:sensor histidine kinase [Lentzea sp. NPDC058436]|uniref:sensor histidine kinase n=1 Tax=Lentzea sp. NPDC058436 TaxID=3346499 RepID=UPI003650526E
MTRALRRAVSAALLLVTVVAVLVSFALMTLRDREKRLQDERDVELIAAVLAVTQDREALRGAVARTRSGPEGRLLVRLPDGGTLGTTPGPAADLSARHLAAPGGGVRVEITSSPARLPLVEAGVLLVALAVTCRAAAALASRLFHPVVVSLRALTEAAGNGERVALPGPPELVALAGAINAATDGAKQSLAREREVIADVSHRLRTPLTALHLEVDALDDDPATQRIRASVVAMERDVDRLIRAFATTAPTTAAGTCDLVAVVAARMAFWSVHAEIQGRHCELALHADAATVPLNRDTVEAVLDVLLDNVFQHTRPPTPLLVEVVAHAGWARLVVEDGGDGIADSEAALRRGSSARGSTGLGLSIARTATEAAGGGVRVDRGKLGGARVILSFQENGDRSAPESPLAWRLWTEARRPS